jgi:hypothetical protein
MAKKFMNKNLITVFENLGYEFEDMRQLMIDTARGVQGVSKKEAEEKISEMFFTVLDITAEEVKNEKLFKRAMRKHKHEVFEVIEDVVEDMLRQGWEESEFFKEFVDTKNLADGDKNEFWTEQEVYLTVAKVSGDHHDILLQRLGEGESYSVKTSTYGAAVGTDIRLFLTGRKDWSELVNAIYKAFDKKIKDTMYAEVMTVGAKLPANSQLNKAISMTVENKDTVDELIELVSAANGGAEVIVMGVSTAIKKFDKLTSVEWISEGMKDAKHETGRLGYYEGTTLVEIPQRLKRVMNGADETLEKLIASDILLVLPKVENKFVKFVNVGDAEILEITEAGARMDDTMKFEYQQSFGISTQIGRYFGVIKITG